LPILYVTERGQKKINVIAAIDRTTAETENIFFQLHFLPLGTLGALLFSEKESLFTSPQGLLIESFFPSLLISFEEAKGLSTITLWQIGHSSSEAGIFDLQKGQILNSSFPVELRLLKKSS
jgi:hypothetical protein